MIFKKFFFVIYLITCSFFEIAIPETYLVKSFIKDLKNCFVSERSHECKKMVSYSEKMQLNEYSNGNFKCQTSILGVQTELIRNIYFSKNKKKSSGKTIWYLIKNC